MGALGHDPSAVDDDQSICPTTVDSRWAITMVVRPAISFTSASWTSSSDSASRFDVASSRMRIFGSANTALAMAIRWR